MTPRAGQIEFELGVDDHRIAGLLARRQYGKTTIAARIALKKMMRTAGHTVVFGSVKLDLGREIVRKEAEVMQRTIRALVDQARQANMALDVVDERGGKSVADVSMDDFAELYESSRLEFRLHHDRSVYSRTKVVALTPEAVGETGDLILDEVGRVRKFREVWEAVKPIIASNPDFRCLLTTTPPPDDTHYSFELLAPPIEAEFPVNPKGNWYRSELGVWVLRVTAADAYADGVPLYDDDTGAALSPEESRAKDPDKDAWDRNYDVKFVLGGTAACGLLALDTAQRRGVGQCEFFKLEEDGDMERAVAWLTAHLSAGKVGLGWDLATTEKATSNPSAFAVAEQVGMEIFMWAIVVWKTRDPLLAEEYARRLILAVAARPVGGRARRLCIDASNERYFAMAMQRVFRGELPVELVIASASIQRAGQEAMSMKQYLGNALVGELEDNHLALPAARYVREDFRLVKRDRGTFVCEADPQGRHGDTFDGAKLALRALAPGSGPAEATATAVGRVQALAGRRLKNPYAAKFESTGATIHV